MNADRSRGRFDDVLEAVGDTPLIRLRREPPAVLVADAAGILGALTRYDLLQHLNNSGEVRRGE